MITFRKPEFSIFPSTYLHQNVNRNARLHQFCSCFCQRNKTNKLLSLEILGYFSESIFLLFLLMYWDLEGTETLRIFPETCSFLVVVFSLHIADPFSTRYFLFHYRTGNNDVVVVLFYITHIPHYVKSNNNKITIFFTASINIIYFIFSFSSINRPVTLHQIHVYSLVVLAMVIWT